MDSSRIAIRATLLVGSLAGLSLILAACGSGSTKAKEPAAPTNVVATPGPGYVTVTWEHSGTDVTGFEVFRSSGSALRAQAATPIGTAAAAARSFTDDGPHPGVTYDYTVVATGAGGCSSAAAPEGGGTTIEPGIDIVMGTYANPLGAPGTTVGVYWFLTAEQVASAADYVFLSGPAGWRGDTSLQLPMVADDSGEASFEWFATLTPVVSGTYEATLEAGGQTFTASATVDATDLLPAPTDVQPTVEGNVVANVVWTAPAGSGSHWVEVYAGTYDDYTPKGAVTTTETSASLDVYELEPGPYFVSVISLSEDVTPDVPLKPDKLNAALGVSDPFSIAPAARCTEPDSVVSILDANLEDAVRIQLSKPSGALTCADMGELTELAWSWPDSADAITNLEGLQHAINLEQLDLDGNRDLPGLAALQGLPKLSELRVSWTDITQDDADVIVSLPELGWLSASGRMFRDLKFLANIPGLHDLELCCTAVDADAFAVLAELDGLEGLDLSENRLTSADLGPIDGLPSLSYLRLARNAIDDLSVLSTLPALTDLNIEELGITDLSSVPNLSNYRWLFLGGNELTDIGALPTTLDHVELDNNYLDLTPGSDAMLKIQALQDAGVEVVYEPQRAAGACFSALFGVDGSFHPVDANGRYLASDPGQVTNEATALALADLGIAPGDCVALRASGTFSFAPGDGAELGNALFAVFTDGAGYLSASDVETVSTTTCDGTDNDVAEDFEVSPFSATYLEVPVGATHLLLAPDDCDGHNNADEDDDFGVLLSHVE